MASVSVDNNNDFDFDTWWIALQELAKDAEWNLGEKSSYKEFYDDGDSPQDALDDDIANYDTELNDG